LHDLLLQKWQLLVDSLVEQRGEGGVLRWLEREANFVIERAPVALTHTGVRHRLHEGQVGLEGREFLLDVLDHLNVAW